MELEFEKEGERKRRKLDGEDQKPAESSRLESLPREIILDILSGLPISSLVQFKSVCRAWRMLVRDPDLVNMHSTRMAEGNPCLIFHCDNPIRNQLYFVQLPACNDKIKEKVKMFDVPFWAAMSEFDVVGSCNGLLCLSDALYNDALYIYNPFSRKYQELPKSMQYLHQELVFGFGFHPTTMEYKVVKIIYYKNSDRCYRRTFRVTSMNSEVQIFTLGSSTWRSMGRAAHHLLQGPSQVLVNGRLHWVTWPRRYKRRSIISFDLADEQFQEVPTPDCYTLNRRKYHLVVLGGCLAAAVYSNFGKLDIWVMREYGVKDSWIKKFNIGSHVPRGFERNVSQSFKISKIISKGRFVRVLCLLQNGEILLEYKSRALVCYDPKSGKFKDLMFQGIPKWFQAVVHVGSLSWIDTFIDA